MSQGSFQPTPEPNFKFQQQSSSDKRQLQQEQPTRRQKSPSIIEVKPYENTKSQYDDCDSLSNVDQIKLINYMHNLTVETMDLKRNLKQKAENFRGYIYNLKENGNQYRLNLSSARNDLNQVVNRIRQQKEQRERNRNINPFLRGFNTLQQYQAYKINPKNSNFSIPSITSPTLNIQHSNQTQVLPTSSAYISIRNQQLQQTANSLKTRSMPNSFSLPRVNINRVQLPTTSTNLSKYGQLAMEQQLQRVPIEINESSSPGFGRKSLYTDMSQIPFESSEYHIYTRDEKNSQFKFRSIRPQRHNQYEDMISGQAADQLKNLDDILDRLRDREQEYFSYTQNFGKMRNIGSRQSRTKTLLKSPKQNDYYEESIDDSQKWKKEEQIKSQKEGELAIMNRFQGSSGLIESGKIDDYQKIQENLQQQNEDENELQQDQQEIENNDDLNDRASLNNENDKDKVNKSGQ